MKATTIQPGDDEIVWEVDRCRWSAGAEVRVELASAKAGFHASNRTLVVRPSRSLPTYYDMDPTALHDFRLRLRPKEGRGWFMLGDQVVMVATGISLGPVEPTIGVRPPTSTARWCRLGAVRLLRYRR